MSRCSVHGGYENPDTGCDTVNVLVEVGNERARQFKLHGANLENLSGTGPEVQWAAPLAGLTGQGARGLELALRKRYNKTEGHVSWLQILLEEFAEVAMEDDPALLSVELIQVAAVCVSWAEKLRDPDSAIGAKA